MRDFLNFLGLCVIILCEFDRILRFRTREPCQNRWKPTALIIREIWKSYISLRENTRL